MTVPFDKVDVGDYAVKAGAFDASNNLQFWQTAKLSLSATSSSITLNLVPVIASSLNQLSSGQTVSGTLARLTASSWAVPSMALVSGGWNLSLTAGTNVTLYPQDSDGTLFPASATTGSTTKVQVKNSGTSFITLYNSGTTSQSYSFVLNSSGSTVTTGLNLTGTVTTLAGSGTASGSTNATGTAARFNGPTAMCSDGTNLYVADSGNNEIRKIVIGTGAVSTLAGALTAGSADGTGTAARFSAPWAITFDGTALYITDINNNLVRKIMPTTGVVTTVAGSGTDGFADGIGTAAEFSSPGGIASDGVNLYVGDNDTWDVRKIVLSSGLVATVAGSNLTGGFSDGVGTAATFGYPDGMIVVGSRLYIADALNNTIRVIQ